MDLKQAADYLFCITARAGGLSHARLIRKQVTKPHIAKGCEGGHAAALSGEKPLR